MTLQVGAALNIALAMKSGSDVVTVQFERSGRPVI